MHILDELEFEIGISLSRKNTPDMQRHEWHVSEGDEKHQYWRANYHAGRWKILRKAHKDEHWETIKEPSTEDWEGLREILFNKYQRKRCAWKMVKGIDKILGRSSDEPQ